MIRGCHGRMLDTDWFTVMACECELVCVCDIY